MLHPLLVTVGVAGVVAFLVGRGAYAVASGARSDGPRRQAGAHRRLGDRRGARHGSYLAYNRSGLVLELRLRRARSGLRFAAYRWRHTPFYTSI
jgi:hypothetical protein